MKIFNDIFLKTYNETQNEYYTKRVDYATENQLF